jgi:hypothetical protein
MTCPKCGTEDCKRLIRFVQLNCASCHGQTFEIIHWEDEPMAWLNCAQCDTFCGKLPVVLQPDEEVAEA